MRILIKTSKSAVIVEASVIEFGIDSDPEAIKIWDNNDNFIIVSLPYSKDMVSTADELMHSSYPVLYAEDWEWEE